MAGRQALCDECAGYGRFWVKEQTLDGRGRVKKEIISQEVDCKDCEGTGRPVNTLLNEEPDFIKTLDRGSSPEKKYELPPEDKVIHVDMSHEEDIEEGELELSV